MPPGLIGVIVALTTLIMSWLNERETSRVSRKLLRDIGQRDRTPATSSTEFPRRSPAFAGMFLNDANRHVPRFEYDPVERYWTDVGDIVLRVHGTSAGPDLERFLIVEPVLQALEALASQAEHDLNIAFRLKVAPLGGWPVDNRQAVRFREAFEAGWEPPEWNFFMVYFGFVGDEPSDEFSLHFDLGNFDPGFDWDEVDGYYAQYRLNHKNPEQSAFIGWNQEDWVKQTRL